MRKILYISGTRADFGLIRATLELAKKSELLDISICVTGNHLLAEYGNTSDEIKNSGLRISGKIPVSVSGQSGEEMTEALGSILSGLVQIVSNEKPDIILVLGDRGEMLMAAIASLHMNIPIVHIHGGELSGTVDESIRHAISKLSHFHFVVTQKARERLIQMGEKPDHIFVTGAPGLVDINKSPLTDKVTLCRRMGFDHEKKIALLIYHPVVQEMHETGQQMAVILDALSEIPLQIICLLPNADAGGASIRDSIEHQKSKLTMNIFSHLDRLEYISWMQAADLMLGNSSSGIIEAASFGLPVLNIGTRQRLRDRNQNVMDLNINKKEIYEAVVTTLMKGKFPCENIYGNGDADQHIVKLLETIPINRQVLEKINSY